MLFQNHLTPRFWGRGSGGLAQGAWITSAYLTVFGRCCVLTGSGCWQSEGTSSRLSALQPTLEVLERVQGVLPQFLGLV